MDGLREHNFLSFAAGGSRPLATRLTDGTLTVACGGIELARLPLRYPLEPCLLVGPEVAAAESDGERILAAAIEALLATSPAIGRVTLTIDGSSSLFGRLIESGSAIADRDDLVVLPELFWQQPAPWLTRPSGAFPQWHILTGGKRHPLRRPKPSGTVYARFIPWLRQVLSFRVIDLHDDLALFHGWMNDPRVAPVWEEAGDLARHRAYLQARLDDPHVLPLVGSFGTEPFGYFEVYWAKENRIAPYYDVEDYDRGWHVAVGEEAFRGKAWITAWLPSLMHFMFLDDPRTQRIVGEPSASHAQQIRNLDKSGFAKIKQFDFPHKRALLVMLLRERFFGERLWAPAGMTSLPVAAVTQMSAGVPDRQAASA